MNGPGDVLLEVKRSREVDATETRRDAQSLGATVGRR